MEKRCTAMPGRTAASLIVLLSFAMPLPGRAGTTDFCQQLAVERPSSARVGLLNLEWAMERSDVERVIGAPMPQPVEVNTIDDITAPLVVAGVDLGISVTSQEHAITEVSLFMRGDNPAALSDCLDAFQGAPVESKLFTGPHSVSASLRWRFDAGTATLLITPDSVQRLSVARTATPEPVLVPAKTLAMMLPDTYIRQLWSGTPVVIVRRSPETISILKSRKSPAAEVTFFQWLAKDEPQVMDVAHLALPVLRSEKEEFGVYLLVSPQYGCFVTPVMKDEELISLDDPCMKQAFDLAGRSFSTATALAIPPYHFSEDGSLVLGLSK